MASSPPEGDNKAPSTPPMRPRSKGRKEGSHVTMEVWDDLSNEPKVLSVDIDRKNIEAKPYRGGFKDVRSGTEYLHALAQTQEPWPPEYVEKKYPEMMSREAQASWMRTRTYQTIKEAFTQMDKNKTYWSLDKNGVVIDGIFDYARVPGPYEDSAAWMQKHVAAAIMIQKHTRRKIAQRTANRMREYAKAKKEARDFRHKLEFWTEQDALAKQRAEEKLHYEIERRIHPESAADFEILYQELEHWRLQEHRKITSTGNERIAAVKDLVNKELRLLQTIDNLRCRAAHINRRKRVKKKLSMMALPKLWEMKNGQLMHVQTPSTVRASDLGQLFEELAKKVESMDDRMAVLGYVKWTVQIYDHPLTREILLLIQREADLMYRGRSARSISGLRQRIEHLFLQFIETPEYNPEAMMFGAVPTDFDYGSKHFQSTRDAPHTFPAVQSMAKFCNFRECNYKNQRSTDTH